MREVQAMLEFVVREGALLAVLFFGIAFVVAMLQQSLGRKLNDALGRTSLGTGALLAATAGAVTPFCSCSTVPVLSGMLRARVRFGVCFSFLIASPVINEGVLLVLLREYSGATAGLFLLVAAGLSVSLGILVDRMGMARFVRLTDPALQLEGAIRIATPGADTKVPWRVRTQFALMAAWTELRASAPYLALGITVGAFVYGYIPEDAIANLQDRFPGALLILVMAVAGVPFYVNAAMVIPIAVALLGKGVAIGPVAAFLVSAAGTSIPEMILLTKLFRAPLVIAHVVSIIASATVIGLALDWASTSI